MAWKARISGIAILALGLGLLPRMAFSQTKIFNVEDFGAKSDGSVDAQASISAAVSAAKAWTDGSADRQATVLFPSGTFSLTEPMHIFAISIVDARNITIRGNSCESWNSSDCTHLVGAPASLSVRSNVLYNTFFSIEKSTGIQIENFYLDKSKPYFTQGIVKDVDVENKTATLTFDQGFSDFSDPLVQRDFNLIMVFTNPNNQFWDHDKDACAPPTATADVGSTCFLYHIKNTKNIAGSVWHVQLDKVPLQSFVGKQFFIWKNVGWQPGILATNVTNLLINHIFYTGGGGPAVHIQQSAGKITISNFDVDIPPKSKRLFSAASGFNGSSNRAQITLDHVRVVHTDDDAFHFSAGPYFPVINESPDRKVIRVDLCYEGQFVPGDQIAAWDWPEKKPIGETHVKSVSIVTDSQPERYRRTCDITVDKELPKLNNLRTYSEKNLGAQSDVNDRIVNLSLQSVLTVKDSYLSSMRARCGIIQIPATIEGNVCENTPDAGFLVGPEYAWGEGYSVDGVKIKNNTFRNIGGTAIYVADIANSVLSPTYEQMISSTNQGPIDNRDIEISGNHFANLGILGYGIMGIRGAAVTISNSKDVILRDNTIDSSKKKISADARELVIAPASTKDIKQ